MGEEKRRYWLKLEKNFLQSKFIKIIKDMPNGKDYILFYLALMLESIESVGHLRFTELVAYDEKMLASLTDTNIDIVRSAMKIFQELGMITMLQDGTIFLPEVPKLTGKESESAERVRRFRARQAQEVLQCNDDVTNSNDNKEKEKEKKKEKQVNKSKEEYSEPDDSLAEENEPAKPPVPVKKDPDLELYNSIQKAFLSRNGDRFTNYGKEGKAIKEIIKKARIRSPDAYDDLIRQMMEKLWELKSSGDRFWSKQPFLPSSLNAAGIWDRVLEEFRDTGSGDIDRWIQEAESGPERIYGANTGLLRTVQ